MYAGCVSAWSFKNGYAHYAQNTVWNALFQGRICKGNKYIYTKSINFVKNSLVAVYAVEIQLFAANNFCIFQNKTNYCAIKFFCLTAKLTLKCSTINLCVKNVRDFESTAKTAE